MSEAGNAEGEIGRMQHEKKGSAAKWAQRH